MCTDVAADHVEGGQYISPEFQIGQVYDGSAATDATDVVLYRPTYVNLVPRPAVTAHHPPAAVASTSRALPHEDESIVMAAATKHRPQPAVPTLTTKRSDKSLRWRVLLNPVQFCFFASFMTLLQKESTNRHRHWPGLVCCLVVLCLISLFVLLSKSYVKCLFQESTKVFVVQSDVMRWRWWRCFI